MFNHKEYWDKKLEEQFDWDFIKTNISNFDYISISKMQRYFKIGYNMAVYMLDKLEEEKIIVRSENPCQYKMV